LTVTSDSATALTAAALLETSPVQLDARFQDSAAGSIPRGRGAGTVLAFPGSPIAKPLARLLGWLVWHGKVFDSAKQDLKNLLTPLEIPLIRAQVYEADSWLDGRSCIVLDYSQSSKVAGWIRDEIREVSPGVYLGLVWGVGRVFGGRRFVLRFALSFPPQT
jgi:hypothetical protein